MASTGGVGGSTNGGGNSNSVGGSGAASAAGKSSDNSNKGCSVGNDTKSNDTAKTNNTDGANAKTGIDREPQQKADLNTKMDSAPADVKAQTAKTEEAKVEMAKAEKTKAETVKAEKVQEQSLTDKVKEKAKELMAKAEDVAKTVKEEVTKAYETAKTQAAFAAKQKELADLARKPEIRAMLDTIGFTEGTGLNYGKVVNGTVIGQNKKNMPYDTTLVAGAKNVTTYDMAQHPNVKVQVNKNLVSSAAGRYQFLSGTWNNLSQKLGLTNFHADTQDIAAVQLMKERNMIEPLLNGDLQTAINRGANEWASLPKADGNGAYAGQNAKSFEAIQNAYNGYLNDAKAMAQAGDYN